MATDPSGLDAAALARLRALVQGLRGKEHAVPLAELTRLAAQAPPGGGWTIDFTAAPALGHPLVILRAAAPEPPAASLAPLSPREREVCARIAEGLSNKQIAARLHIALATVKDHVHRILSKTDLPNRAAVAAAWRDRSRHAPRDGSTSRGA